MANRASFTVVRWNLFLYWPTFFCGAVRLCRKTAFFLFRINQTIIYLHSKQHNYGLYT